MVFGCRRVESKGKRLWEGEHLSWIQEAGEPWVRMNTGFYENLSTRTYHQVSGKAIPSTGLRVFGWA